MKKEIIKTIDLWTEPYPNYYECFNGSFVDGFEDGEIPFDRYVIYNNCNCKIAVDKEDIHITNKHKAIVFYKENRPVRLSVLCEDTDYEKCINIALEQFFRGEPLRKTFLKYDIKGESIDLKEKPIYNNCDKTKEIDTGSCDRWNLLYCMLKGSYTESDTKYGNFQSDIYEFIPNIEITYDLKTKSEQFLISHSCAFINNIRTRIIPIQDNSRLTNN